MSCLYETAACAVKINTDAADMLCGAHGGCEESRDAVTLTSPSLIAPCLFVFDLPPPANHKLDRLLYFVQHVHKVGS